MKTISIKTHEKRKVKNEDNAEMPLNTLELMRIVLHTPPSASGSAPSFTVDEMRKRIKILDKIDELAADSTVIELEDAEAKLLSNLVDKQPWTAMDKFIIEFADSLK
jgi:hypothetical protein